MTSPWPLPQRLRLVGEEIIERYMASFGTMWYHLVPQGRFRYLRWCVFARRATADGLHT